MYVETSKIQNEFLIRLHNMNDFESQSFDFDHPYEEKTLSGNNKREL